MTHTDIYEIAEEGSNLRVIETTTGANGYPQNLCKAIIGFDTFEEAEALADKYNMELTMFTQRDGWQLWYRTGWPISGPIKITDEDYGSDYLIYAKSDMDGLLQEFKDMIKDCESFEEAEAILELKREIWDRLDDAEDDEYVITNFGKYFDTVKKQTMNHYHDSKHYAVGVIYK